MNENDAYLFDVELPSEWVFPGKPVWVSGWFLAKNGAVFSDIRAVIDGIPHMGIFGLPRPEIEKKHRGYTGLPHAGFSLYLKPPRRARLFRLEVLDAGHQWVEIWRQKIKVRHGDNTIGRFNLGLLSDQMHRLLQARRVEPAADPVALALPLVLEAAAVPLDTLPNPPFFGALEKPELIGGTQFGKVRVEGWLIHLEQRITRLTASTHPLVENELDYGNRPRPEAAALFPNHPCAGISQYFGMLDIDETVPGPVLIRMFAELDDGTRHLVFARRFYPRSCNIWERPLPVFNRRLFFSSARALFAAARQRRIRWRDPLKTWQAFATAYRNFRRLAPEQTAGRPENREPYQTWRQADQLTPQLRKILLTSAAPFMADGPTFTLLIDTRECSAGQLAALAQSLRSQLYPRWEAWFVGPVAGPIEDIRFHHARAPRRKDQIQALNTAAHRAKGTLLTLLPGHSQLSPDALLEIAGQFASRPGLQLAYTDEDRIKTDGTHTSPDFKPEWSPAFLLSGLFPGRLSVVRRDRFITLGSFREHLVDAAWYDVLLRLADQLTTDQVAHVPLVCHHGWAEANTTPDLAHPVYEEMRKALQDALHRRGWPASASLPESGHHRRTPFQQIRWNPDLVARLPVTLVIPTRDRLHLLQECVELLEETVDWRHHRLVIVDDHSRDEDAIRYLERIQARTDLHCTVVRLPDPHAPFNYSRLVNAALPHVTTPLIAHLNNDVNALERGWLEEMSAWFTQEDVGVVGTKLLYPDKTLNHTGIVIGPHGGLADTLFAKEDERSVDLRWHAATREVSAVTGACLMTRTDLYRTLGGFDETAFGVAYNDVDYCLRVRAAGRRVLYTPQAKLMHWGSATRGVTFNESEHIAFVRRYPSYRDPYFSPYWELAGTQVRCHASVAPRTGRVGSLRVLLLTHNLNLEGAPLFLLEYATWLVREAGFGIEVITGQDGPLRTAFADLGAGITTVDFATIMGAADEAAFQQRVAAAGRLIQWEQIDLVVNNTLASFWGVHLARQAGKASLIYIHESTSIFRFFENSLALPLHPLVGSALATATRALFLCAATRAYYEDCNRHGNFRIVPSWIRVDDIDRFRAIHDRVALRRKHGLREDEIIVANIGTVCERKGQHIFIRAIDHFNRHDRGTRPVRFVMVGARPGIYLDLLRRDIARLGLQNVLLIPETRDAFDFFAMADLFVCTSYEESFPRVVLEAMAFRTPIVSTDVHGIADLIGQRQDGYLVKPGDVTGLARMMRTCLAKEHSGKSLTPTAYSKVLRLHDAAKVLPLHVEIARDAWLAHK